MATSNYDEIIAKAQAAMANGGQERRKPISSLSSPLLSIYLGFFGFASGTLFGLLTDIPTLYCGAIGAVLGVVLALVMRWRWRAKIALGDMAQTSDALEREAVKLEAEVARQSGAFDQWEKP